LLSCSWVKRGMRVFTRLMEAAASNAKDRGGRGLDGVGKGGGADLALSKVYYPIRHVRLSQQQPCTCQALMSFTEG
jgi:hypothetical protein